MLQRLPRFYQVLTLTFLIHSLSLKGTTFCIPLFFMSVLTEYCTCTRHNIGLYLTFNRNNSDANDWMVHLLQPTSHPVVPYLRSVLQIESISRHICACRLCTWVVKEEALWTKLSLVPEAEWGQLCVWLQSSDSHIKGSPWLKTGTQMRLLLKQFITSQKEKPNRSRICTVFGNRGSTCSQFQRGTKQQERKAHT